MFLPEDKIIELTKKRQHHAQRTVLNFLGIAHKPRPDGSLLVREVDVDKAFGGAEIKTKKTAQPNWDALENA